MNGLTSSVIVAHAMRLEPDGAPAREACQCCMCGLPIDVGDLCAPLPFGEGFMDDLSLACRGSQHICGYCAVLVSPEALRATGYGVFSIEGVRPFRKWADVGAALLDPPKAPYVMTYATANNQHMAWRAPVNYSRDLLKVRVGLRDLYVRRAMLAKLVNACADVAAALGIEAKGKTLANPFLSLSPDLKDANHARLNPRVYGVDFVNSASAPIQAAVRLIQNATLGETWALRFVLTPGAGQSKT